MPNPTPFSLKIFVADGDPDGLRIVERTNWIGKAIVFPRTIFSRIKTRNEFSQTGVYLLLGPQEKEEGEKIYIGEGDPIKPRLESHFANKDFWNRAVFFVAGSGQLNKAHVQFLEARLIERANNLKRLPLDNGNNPTEPTLSEADKADMEVFLQHMLSMLPILGIHAFEEIPTINTPRSTSEIVDTSAIILTCKSRKLTARGYESTQGFVVQSGSQAILEPSPSLKKHFPHVAKTHQDLRAQGVLKRDEDHNIFTRDYVFNSPSAASSLILGHASNGRVDWKDIKGRTLKEIQAQQEAD